MGGLIRDGFRGNNVSGTCLISRSPNGQCLLTVRFKKRNKRVKLTRMYLTFMNDNIDQVA